MLSVYTRSTRALAYVSLLLSGWYTGLQCGASTIEAHVLSEGFREGSENASPSPLRIGGAPRILTVLTTYSERTLFAKNNKDTAESRRDGYTPTVRVEVLNNSLLLLLLFICLQVQHEPGVHIPSVGEARLNDEKIGVSYIRFV